MNTCISIITIELFAVAVLAGVRMAQKLRAPARRTERTEKR